RFQLQAAEIVVSAFEIGGPDRSFEDTLQKRDVFVKDLILEGFGSRGDENALAVQQGGQKVGQRLSGSGACLDNDVILLFERPMPGLRHADLRRPMLVVVQPLFECAAGPEEVVNHQVSVPPERGQRRGLLSDMSNVKCPMSNVE